MFTTGLEQGIDFYLSCCEEGEISGFRKCRLLKIYSFGSEKGCAFSTQKNNAMFISLDAYLPQLTNPTKSRAKRPGTRRIKKNESCSETQLKTPGRATEHKTPGPSCHRKEYIQESPQTTHAIRDPNKESSSPASTRKRVNKLRARFEQMSG